MKPFKHQRKMPAHQLAQKEIGLSRHWHLTHLNDPTIFELDNGQIGSTLYIKGVPFDTATNDELNSYKRTLHQALCMLSEEFCLYASTLRRKMDMGLEGKFNEAFTRTVNQKYHAQFRKQGLYTNELYLTILYRGIDSGTFSKTLYFLQKLSHRTIKTAREHYRQQAIQKLKQVVGQLITKIARFQPHLLGLRDNTLNYSELLTFHSVFVNGLKTIHFKNPHLASPLSLGLKADKALELYPQGNIAHYLTAKRIFFGDYIEFRETKEKSQFASMLSLKTYGTDTASIMLDKLLHLDGEFIHTNSFAIASNEMAHKKIIKQWIRMDNANDPALSQKQQLSQLRDDLASDRLKVGYHHNSLMLLANKIDHLQELVKQTIKIYSDIGFVAVEETIGAEPAFWAQCPGNQKYIVRSGLITSQNFVSFSPLHNYETGYRDRNHLGSALSLLETPSKTPMFFNFHAKGSGDKNDLTPGHTTLIGGNGSGKTVFLGFMDSQMSRYGGQSFFFDRDRGMEIYIRAAGGRYFTIHPNHADEMTFNPFWLKDTPQNRSFIKNLIGQLIKRDEEAELPGDIDAQIAECVHYAYDSLSKTHRNLGHATRLLPMDFARWSQLKKWLRSADGKNDGEYAYLFDNPKDQLDLTTHKLGFDLTELMSQPSSVLTPVCMYLVHRIKESLKGQRVSLYFDEGWQVLDHPYWKKQLKQDLPTLRKSNTHIVLATQSPGSVIHSVLSAEFLDNCATHLFFCNEKANYQQHYQHFNITPHEFHFIKNTPREYRLFLYKQSEYSAICKLNLTGMEDELAIYSANKSTIHLLDELRKEQGDDPKKWLPLFHQRRQHRS